MDVKTREGMEAERCELVQAVKDETVVPHDDGGHEAAHAEYIVCLEKTDVRMLHWIVLEVPCTS